jgi:hypothetical protein
VDAFHEIPQRVGSKPLVLASSEDAQSTRDCSEILVEAGRLSSGVYLPIELDLTSYFIF